MTTLTDTVPEITYADSVAVSGIISLIDLGLTNIDSSDLGFNGITTLKNEKIASSIPITSTTSYFAVGSGGGGGSDSGGGGSPSGSQSIELIIY